MLRCVIMSKKTSLLHIYRFSSNRKCFGLSFDINLNFNNQYYTKGAVA